jgi:hypothetical protein
MDEAAREAAIREKELQEKREQLTAWEESNARGR